MHQLIFNIDTAYTLQYMHLKLLQKEAEQTSQYIKTFIKHIPGNFDKTCIGNHMYIIGKYKSVTPSLEQARCLNSERPITYFFAPFEGRHYILFKRVSQRQTKGFKRQHTLLLQGLFW